MTGNGSLRDIGNASVFGAATARSGGDVFNLNGKTLTIDQDTRYGLSGATAYSLGSITVSATLGGVLNIDGSKVRMVPFVQGSGTVTLGGTITCGSATAKVIGIQEHIAKPPVTTIAASVSLLMHMDGADNGATFTDFTGKAFTPSGNAQTKTATKKFGTASAYFDGAGDWISTPSHVGFDFNTGDLAVEFFINTTDAGANKTIINREWGASPYTGGWTITINAGKITVWNVAYSNATAMLISPLSYNDGQWHHVCWERYNGLNSLYIDGTRVISIANAGAVAAGAGALTIGNDVTFGAGARALVGYIDEVRIIKGSTPYRGANFTAPTAAFTDSTNGAVGWLKVTEWNGVAFPTTGTFTQAGYTFTMDGPDKAGFIEVVGDESSTITANRLGAVNITGEWFEVGTTTGVNTDTYQLPTNGSIQYYPAVWVETGVGTGVYEPYPCAGTLVAAASTATDAVRGKVCWASTAGVLRFGRDGTNAVGYTPTAGLKIRIPNILTANCTTAARTANVLPNATLATRYDFTTTGGGVINIDKALLNWYPSFAQAYSVNMSDVGISTQLSMSEVAQPINLTRVCVGQEAANAQFGLLMSLCFAGGTFNSCVFTSASLAASGRYVQSIADIAGFTFNNCKDYSFVFRANATTGAATITRAQNCTWNNQQIGLGQYALVTCTKLTFNNTVYHDCITTTGTTNAMSVWALSSNTAECTFNGLTFGGLTNVQPYTAIVAVNAAGCRDIKLRNIGTSPSSQLSLGSTNGTGTVLALANGAAAQDIKMQRVFASNTRTNLYSGDNSSTRISVENCMGDYADTPTLNMLNLLPRGIGCTNSVTGQTSIYGTVFTDTFASAVLGRIRVYCNEATSGYSITAGTPGFTGVGTIYMPTVGDQIIWEFPYYALGHTGFTTLTRTVGSVVGNWSWEMQYDKNDGTGWNGTWIDAAVNGNLTAITGIDPAKGVKLKFRITTLTASTSNTITTFCIETSSTAIAQANYYPLDLAPISLSGLQNGSDIIILQAGTTTEIVNINSNSGSTYSTTIDAGSYPSIDVCVYKQGYVPFSYRGLSVPSIGLDLPINQVADRNFYNPA